jgi:nucleoside-diphosphate-sugar epimerase
MNKQLIIDQKPARKGDQQRTEAMIDKARTLLGYEPKVTFKAGLEAQVNWYFKKIAK